MQVDFQRFEGRREELWAEIRAGLSGDPTNDELCTLGVGPIEALIDLYWVDVVDDFEREARGNRQLRMAMSCAPFSDEVPDDVHRRLHDLIAPDEDIGSTR